jgi:ankyrin repeat protein
MMPFADTTQMSDYDIESVFHNAVTNQATDVIAILRPRIKRPAFFTRVATCALRSDDVPAAKKLFKDAQDLAKQLKSTLVRFRDKVFDPKNFAHIFFRFRVLLQDLVEGSYVGITAWQVAVEKENQEMLQLCFDVGDKQSINVGNLYGWGKPTPLSMAAMAGSVACVETLLRFGASPLSDYTLHAIVSGTSETENRHQECMDAILAKAAPIKPHQALTAANAKGFNFLHLAAMNGHIQLFNHAAEIIRNAGDAALRSAYVDGPNGLNALALAASKGHADIVSIALDKLKFPINSTSTSKPGWQAIHFAAAAGHDRIVDLLASRGADVEALTHDDHSPATLAQKSGYASVITVLKNYGAKIVSQIDEQLKMIVDTGKSSSVRLMSFQDVVPAHLNYPNDVRALSSNNANATGAPRAENQPTSKVSHRHTSANTPWRTARLFISSTFEGSFLQSLLLGLPHFGQLTLAFRRYAC